jgi:serine protease AprX
MARQHLTQAGGFRRRWRWSVALIAFALAALSLSGADASTPGNVHGSVFAWAHQNPGEPVPVIVQTTENSDSLVSAIESAGGAVDRKFQIISAVEGHVPASAVTSLAADSAVSWVSLNAPIVSAGSAVQTRNLATTYPMSVGAQDAWSKGYDGDGVGVAVIDTGITSSNDFIDNANRIVASVAVNPATTSTADGLGHGTHVSGIIGGDGSQLAGKYIGIAPGANLINVKVADDSGNASLSDVIAGMEFVYANSSVYNIRVVNMSLNTSVAQSFKTDPLCAAAEALWFHGVFVVAASGNSGSAADAVGYCPGNDPFVMTVGAIDDRGTISFSDDVPASWSSFGTTQDGFAKPDLLTPGVGIISDMDSQSLLYQQHPANVVGYYFSMSGTSMSSGVMSGVAALVLQRHPDWEPGQLKCTLVSKSRSLAGKNSMFRVPRAGDTSNQSKPSCNSDTGIAPSAGFGKIMKAAYIAGTLDQTGPGAVSTYLNVDLSALGLPNSVSDTTFDLSLVDWSSIKWDSIKWDSIKWDSIKWDSIKWDSIKWDSIKWDSLTPDGVDFNSIKWDAIKWDAIKWSAIKWDSIKWNSIKWDSIKWDFFPDGP